MAAAPPQLSSSDPARDDGSERINEYVKKKKQENERKTGETVYWGHGKGEYADEEKMELMPGWIMEQRLDEQLVTFHLWLREIISC